jgi:hypothetical protein
MLSPGFLRLFSEYPRLFRCFKGFIWFSTAGYGSRQFSTGSGSFSQFLVLGITIVPATTMTAKIATTIEETTKIVINILTGSSRRQSFWAR